MGNWCLHSQDKLLWPCPSNRHIMYYRRTLRKAKVLEEALPDLLRKYILEEITRLDKILVLIKRKELSEGTMRMVKWHLDRYSHPLRVFTTKKPQAGKLLPKWKQTEDASWEQAGLAIISLVVTETYLHREVLYHYISPEQFKKL